MQFTISQLRDHLWCEQYSHNLHTLRRSKPRSSTALWLGDLFHRSMAGILRAEPREALLASLLAESLEPEVEREFREMLPFLHTWQVPATWTIHQVERPIEAAVGRHQLLARPDALITDEAGTWLAQWKTLGRSFDLGVHQERVRLSFHECAYHFAANIAAPSSNGQRLRVAGTILGTYKKLTKAELANGRDPFTLVRLPRTSSEVISAIEDIARIADRMEESIRSNRHLRNLDACFGRFGNSQCQFYDVCHGSSSLNDPPFEDQPDRYADLPIAT